MKTKGKKTDTVLTHAGRDPQRFFGVVNTPQYRALNPNGLVPTIEDGPFVLWESNTIVRYLTAKHSSGKLWPEDLKIRAVADKWMDFMLTTFWPAFRQAFYTAQRSSRPAGPDRWNCQ